MVPGGLCSNACCLPSLLDNTVSPLMHGRRLLKTGLTPSLSMIHTASHSLLAYNLSVIFPADIILLHALPKSILCYPPIFPPLPCPSDS